MRLHFCNKCGNDRPVGDNGTCIECSGHEEIVERPSVDFEIVIPEKNEVSEAQKVAAVERFKAQYNIK